MTDGRSRLRRLDDAWVSAAARRWRRIRSGPSTPGPIGRGLAAIIGATRAEPALAGSIAVVLGAGILFGTAGTGPDTGSTKAPAVVVPTLPPATPVATIGPAPGSSVPVYLSRAADDLRRYAQLAAPPPTYAVVDLRRYVSPAAARRVLGATQLAAAYVRVPTGLPTPPRRVPIATGSDLDRGILTTAAVARATAKSYAALLAALHPRTRQDRLLKQRYRLMHRAAIVEARRLARPESCRCVFALVVRGGLATLQSLAHDPLVRVVDPAPAAVPLTGLTVLPLEPQATSVVPRDGLPGG